MDTADRLALHELAARYGDLIDERDWEGLSEFFTEDAVYDLSGLGTGELHGLDAIRRHVAGTAHPRAHHITNIHVTVIDGQPELRSRILGMLEDRRVASGQYRDRVVKTAAGWRVCRRTFVPRGHRTDHPFPFGSKG